MRSEDSEHSAAGKDNESPARAPTIQLPSGGGAIRGIGEKFAANPVTGTGSMSVPIATSPGRSGFGPHLSLSYDSGAGNGPFGFGWRISLPSISRNADKRLPQYFDAVDSDVFFPSGADDLEPVYRQDASGSLAIHEVEIDGFRVRRYRPRTEGLFTRIERWSKIDSPSDVHWRSISKDNVLTLYGFDTNSRIADPSDSSRIFTWLICETRDDKGNAVLYRYKAEDGQGVDLTKAHERNRGHRNDALRTANRYLKRIHYGNRTPLLDSGGRRPRFLDMAQIEAQIADAEWMFEVVFDYGDHDPDSPRPGDDQLTDEAGAPTYPWQRRPDSFSSYRSGFEVRTHRSCRRVLMFHHFPDEAGVDRDCLVRSTDFVYSNGVDPSDVRNPVYTFLKAATQAGYRRNNDGYDKRSLPPVEFEYTQPVVQDAVEEVSPDSLENLPIGADGSAYRWIDLHGEGIAGILTEQAGTWYYKRNLSPIGSDVTKVKFAPLETVALKPNVAMSSGAEFMDLAGDGQPDLVVLEGSGPGLYEHDEAEGWQPFRVFTSRLNRDLRDANVRLIDLDGDGHADVLITEDDALVWHASLAEEGFGPARRVAQALDEEKGPRVVFADGTQSIYLADLSGDGLTDIVRIRDGEVCYWPNLGHGRFGAKVTMDDAPWFEFDHKRIRLADIDGSGTTDIIYLHHEGVRIYFNQSGNRWSQPHHLKVFPRVDDVVSVVPTDLLGNGTACLVWSSPLPADAGRPMRYVNLMGGQKPHLLVRTINNLGAETRIDYAPSTRFYLEDKRDGKPWITRLPFPVHVVERVETYDHISRNRFVTRYAYHHGYFDGKEREFRGFGMVEQWDSEQFAVLVEGRLPADNIGAASHVPPVHTKTWFHTGAYHARERISRRFEDEYFREPGLTAETARPLLLDDTTIPPGLTLDEEREACRALKGSMLRQEVYADDADHAGATPAQVQRASTPYTVTEQNFRIRILQPRGANRHAVFCTHASEAISYHYERNPADPRIQHALTLEVDDYGNVLKQADIGYGRRVSPLTEQRDCEQQTRALMTCTENVVSNAVDNTTKYPDDYRSPQPCEFRSYELTGVAEGSKRLSFQQVFDGIAAAVPLDYEEEPPAGQRQKRLIEQVRTLYRKDDLSDLLPLGTIEPLALPGESYKLAFTPGLIAQVFQRPHHGQPDEPLLPEGARDALLGGQAGNHGGYVDLDGNAQWWIPSGRSFYHPDNVSPAVELSEARAHFFLQRAYRDPFGKDATVKFDGPADPAKPGYDLLMVDTHDALGNRITVEAIDYRVLQPSLVSDSNRNRTEVAFDVFGMVVGTAVMGKPQPALVEGDTLSGFATELSQAQLDQFMSAPRQPSVDPSRSEPSQVARDLLRGATTRIVYDLDRFRRLGEPPFAATIARETHVSDLAQGQASNLQIGFSYSDGFGREIQKKIQAEPGPLDLQDPQAPIVSPRWVGSGWTIFNNKGKPVRQYEPFFSAMNGFEFGVQVGVSPVLFYDPAGRLISTLHPNHTFEKAMFDPWQQTTWDVNDTCAARNAQTGDPRTDPDIAGYLAGYFQAMEPAVPAWQTWHAQRIGGALGQDERNAALRAEAHADTPTTAHFDALGRPFLTIARNRVVCAGHDLDGTDESIATRVQLDIEGNQRAVLDERRLPVDYLPTGALERRIVMRYAYDMLGNRIHQLSMEAGARWMLNDAAGKPIRAWDSRGHNFSTSYDDVRRPVAQAVRGTTVDSDPRTLNRDILVDRIEYGEAVGNAEALNLRTRIYRHFDSAGVATNARLDVSGNPIEAYDFKGNLRRSTRRLVSDYTAIPDWSQNPQLDTESFDGGTRYDALNRPVQSIAPHSTLVRPAHPNRINVIQPVFNEANLLERVDVWLERAAEPLLLLNPATEVPSPVGVANIDYDAKGQRQRIDHKNGANTFYSYDPLTLRLTGLLTRRNNPATFPGDDPNPDIAGWPGRQVQKLHYTYDPAGNITHIQDDAQQTIYFRNRRVEPGNDYVYDALYRLIQASGREHLGQGGAPIAHSHNDAGRVGLLSADPSGRFGANDGNAMGTYIERYVYDAVGNFLKMQHRGNDPAHAGWTRAYDYGEASLIEDGTGGAPLTTSNRLSRTTLNPNGANPPQVEPYQHDAHGNIVRMPHLGAGLPGPNMYWDYKNRLRQTDLGGGGVAWYVYDASGQRVRKVWAKAPGLTEERIYTGGFEIFRRHGGPIGASTASLERETLHVMDDKQRIALVETRTLDVAGNDASARQLICYQFGNHLGSVNLELDDHAQIISYEEFTPYGSSVYQAVRSQTETAKRYRYTGKERDAETGLSYHGARYYVPWIGMWTSCDPAGGLDGANLYRYVSGNPVRLMDATGLAGTDNASTEPTPMESDVSASSVANHVAGPPKPEVGPYSKKGPAGESPVGGDHIHQVAARTARVGAARKGASQFREALAVRTKNNPSYNDAGGQLVERRFNRAMWGESMSCRPADVKDAESTVVKEGVVNIEATGETTVGASRPATPSPWAENQKSSVKLREAGKSATEAAELVLRSDAQLASSGASPMRVPDAPRNTPKSLQEGQRLSSEMPPSEVLSNLPPEPGVLESPGMKHAVTASGEALQGAGRVMTVYAAAKSGEHVLNAIEMDIRQGTAGEQTARTVAHEAAGWAGAMVVGGEGAALGLLCGPFAEVCSPVGGLVFGIVGYYGGSGSVDSFLYFATGR